MIDYVTEYANRVVNGDITTVGRLAILACERHLRDLSRCGDLTFDYVFDVEESNRIIDFAESLVIGEGDDLQQLELYDYQKFILGSLMGWVHKENRCRRFRESYIQLARQQGKTILSGVLSAYISSFCGYRNGKIILAGTKMQQAKLCYDDIVKFINVDEDLQECFEIKDYKNEIISNVTGTKILAFGRDTKGIDGHRAILGVCDELHQHPSNQMYKLIQGGQGKLKEALVHAITTAGFDLDSFCKEHYDLCVRVLEQTIVKDTQFVYIAQMDDDDDIWDYRNWVKANPTSLLNHDYSYNMDAIKIMQEVAIDAKEKGGQDLVDFMTKKLNKWVDFKESAYLNLSKLAKCKCITTLDDVNGMTGYLGIDLSSGGDLTSIALIFPMESNKVFVYSHSFIPEMRLLEHEKTDLKPYREWVNKGLLTPTSALSGFKTDYKYIISHLKELIEKYKIKVRFIGYDHHNASAFLADLEQFGVPLVDIPQSCKHLNEATEDFRIQVDAGNVLINKDSDLLMWSFSNAITVSNSFGEVKIDKNYKTKRIDPCDAVICAWDVMIKDNNKPTLSDHLSKNFTF